MMGMTIVDTIMTIAMRDIRISLFLGFVVSLVACGTDRSPQTTSDIQITELPTACQKGGEGNLFATADGKLYLSWVEYVNDSLDELRFSRLEGREWSKAKPIASGTDWFVNWADFPSLVANEKQLAAHWLQKSANGTYDYDVRIAQSSDGGATWSPSFIPHTDGIAAEHGFVSLLPLSNGRFFATWLDGRNTKTEEQEHNASTDEHGHHGGGAMTLRTAEFDTKAQLIEEAELDNRICDCCQTAAALTTNGPIVVYRDRSEEEVRDISIVRKVNGSWTTPKRVHKDNWLIRGCPVNGPSVAADGNRVAVAWYTMQEDQPRVNIAFSEDAGALFQAPIPIDTAQTVGRVDVLFWKNDTVLLSWISQVEDEGLLQIAKVHSEKGVLERIPIAPISLARKSGFPRMERLEEQVFLVWTDVERECVKTLLIEGI